MEKSKRQIENEEKRKRWKKRVAAWEESGLTQIEYCRIHELNSGRFTYWKSRLKKKNDPPTLVPIPINPDVFKSEPICRSLLRLNIENGLQIEIEKEFDPVLLTALIRTVRDL